MYVSTRACVRAVAHLVRVGGGDLDHTQHTTTSMPISKPAATTTTTTTTTHTRARAHAHTNKRHNATAR